MAKSKSRTPEAEGDPGGAPARGSVSLRIEAQTRRLIDDAAAVVGKTRTAFMIESARRSAVDVLADRRLILLDAADHEAFARVLDDPPPPGPKLRAVLSRVPVWKR